MRILVVEDDERLNEVICRYLNRNGYPASGFTDSYLALDALSQSAYDLVISDVMMPKMDGFELAEHIRRISQNLPILFVTALDDLPSKRRGFQIGIDDYIVKPFPLSVLLRKCEAAVARWRGGDGNKQLSCGGLTLDLSARAVFAEARSLPVTGKDFDLLSLLMQNKGRTLGRETLLNRVWGYGFEGDIRVVDTHIKTLRKALGAYASLIRTVVGVGYRFEEAAV